MRVLLFLGLFSLGFQAAAQSSFAAADALFSKAGLGKNSSYCVMNEGLDQLAGKRDQSKVRIASVSKIFTTFFVLNRLGTKYRFATRFFYDPKTQHLHIHGSRDPFMGERVLQFIIAKLNEMKIYSVQKVTYSEDFSFFRKVEYKSELYTEQAALNGYPRALTQNDLETFFGNPMRSYAQTKEEAKKVGVTLPPTIELKVQKGISFLSQFDHSPQPGSYWIDYFSAPLPAYLKELNKWSMNYVADEVLAALGGIGEMNQFLKERFDFTSQDAEFYTGSGLELYLDPKGRLTADSDQGRNRRLDNLATCDAVITVIASLSDLLVKNNLTLADVMLVGGADDGTFGGSAIIDNSAIVKTGTLNSTVALVGQLSTQKAPYYFGIFFDLPDKTFQAHGRATQLAMLESITQASGGRKEYKVAPVVDFIPFDAASIYSIKIQPVPRNLHDQVH